MRLIVCLDPDNGMLFNNRRQSKDRVVRQDMLEMARQSALWMDAYSCRQFAEDDKARICVHASFWEQAAASDYCFAETAPLQLCIGRAEQIIVYRWNRDYPASDYFPTAVLNKWKRIAAESLVGYSHEEIIKEVYIP